MRNLAGMRFGKLVVQENIGKNRLGGVLWLCKCDCGNSLTLSSTQLLNGGRKSCGCQKRYKEMTGKKFDRLTVIGYAGPNVTKQALWKCLCDCGKEIIAQGTNIRSGNTKSCGCIQSEIVSKQMFKHGQSGTRTYKIWKGMKQRCYNSNNSDYQRYGGRGIKICDRWLESFENFYEDMGEALEGTSIAIVR